MNGDMKVIVLPNGNVHVSFTKPKPHGQLFLANSPTAKRLKEVLSNDYD